MFVDHDYNDQIMWSLIMGSVYSSEDEAMVDNVSDEKLITTAPRREDGDGMEKPPDVVVQANQRFD